MARSFKQFIATVAVLLCAFAATHTASGANRFWYASFGCSGGGGDGYWAQQGTAVGPNWRVTDDGTCPGSTFWASADDAVFGGAAGTVTVRFSAVFNANSVRVKTDGYKFYATGGSATTFVLATGKFTVDTGMTTMTTGVNVQTLRWGVASPNPFIVDGFGTLNMSVAASSVIAADKIWITNATLITVGSGSTPNTPASFTADWYKMNTNGMIFYKGYSPTFGVNGGVTIGANGGRIQTDTGNATFQAVFTGSGTLTKLGNGKLTLGADNSSTFTGSNWVSAGTLTVSNNNALGSTSIGTQVSSGGALELVNAAATIYAAEPLVLNGTGVNQGGALVNTANNHTFTGPITLGSSGVQINSTAQLLVISGGISGASNPNLVLAGAGNMTISNQSISIGSGQLTKTNSGTLTLQTSNNFSGGFLISGGTVNFDTNTCVGTGPITITPVAATVLRSTVAATTITNDLTVNTGSSTIDLFATSGNTLTFSGKLSGAAAVTRGAGGGAGVIALTGDNSGWTGGMTLVGGILSIGHPNALGTGNFNVTGTSLNTSVLTPSASLSGGSSITNKLLMNTNLIVNGANDLEWSGPVNLLLLTRTLTVSNTGGMVISGVISGTGPGLTKAGTSNLTLTAANTYDGATTVAAGKLTVNNTSGSGTGAGSVTVQTGGTLAGTGSVSGGVTVNSGGTLAPGESIGTFTAGASSGLSGTTSMEIDRDAGQTADKFVITSGTLTYGGTLAVANLGATPQGADSFDLFDAPNFSGSFSSFSLPALPGGFSWYTGYLTNDGTILVNRPPSNTDKSYARAAGTTLKLSKAALLVGATDPDSGDAPTSVSAVGSGTEGATVSQDATYIYYAPVNNNADTLQYSTADMRGGLTTNNISITVVNQGGLAQSIAYDSGGVTVVFAGIPGISYDIERSATSDFSSYTVLYTTNAPSGGIFTIIDSSPLNPSGFYRTKQN